ncbi:MAG: helix-turn-helix domain-containing protein [Caulobacterales bacterium]
MPLDTGAYADALGSGQQAQERSTRRLRATLNPDIDIGSALRLARESLGLTVDDISAVTKVRVAHLEALEAMAIDRLPARAFAIGYVRAYAKALGLDADAVAARFRAENPDDDGVLRTPVGVRHQRGGRSRPLIAVAAVAIIALVAWNVARHAMAQAPHGPRAAAPARIVHISKAPPTSGAFSVNAPLPAPPEATAPDPYATPGLAAAAAAGGSADAADAAARAEAAAAKPVVVASGAPFTPEGAIYGSPVGQSGIIVQARKPLSLIVRGKDGAVYFARQLAQGEAYRVPALADITAEVSSPANAEIFVGGRSKGVFSQPTETYGKLAG